MNALPPDRDDTPLEPDLVVPEPVQRTPPPVEGGAPAGTTPAYATEVVTVDDDDS